MISLDLDAGAWAARFPVRNLISVEDFDSVAPDQTQDDTDSMPSIPDSFWDTFSASSGPEDDDDNVSIVVSEGEERQNTTQNESLLNNTVETTDMLLDTRPVDCCDDAESNDASDESSATTEPPPLIPRFQDDEEEDSDLASLFRNVDSDQTDESVELPPLVPRPITPYGLHQAPATFRPLIFIDPDDLSIAESSDEEEDNDPNAPNRDLMALPPNIRQAFIQAATDELRRVMNLHRIVHPPEDSDDEATETGDTASTTDNDAADGENDQDDEDEDDKEEEDEETDDDDSNGDADDKADDDDHDDDNNDGACPPTMANERNNESETDEEQDPAPEPSDIDFTVDKNKLNLNAKVATINSPWKEYNNSNVGETERTDDTWYDFYEATFTFDKNEDPQNTDIHTKIPSDCPVSQEQDQKERPNFHEQDQATPDRKMPAIQDDEVSSIEWETPPCDSAPSPNSLDLSFITPTRLFHAPGEPSAPKKGPSSPIIPFATRQRQMMGEDDPAIRQDHIESLVEHFIHTHTAYHKEENPRLKMTLEQQLPSLQQKLKEALTALQLDEQVHHSRLSMKTPSLSSTLHTAWELATISDYGAIIIKQNKQGLPGHAMDITINPNDITPDSHDEHLTNLPSKPAAHVATTKLTTKPKRKKKKPLRLNLPSNPNRHQFFPPLTSTRTLMTTVKQAALTGLLGTGLLYIGPHLAPRKALPYLLSCFGGTTAALQIVQPLSLPSHPPVDCLTHRLIVTCLPPNSGMSLVRSVGRWLRSALGLCTTSEGEYQPTHAIAVAPKPRSHHDRHRSHPKSKPRKPKHRQNRKKHKRDRTNKTTIRPLQGPQPLPSLISTSAIKAHAYTMSQNLALQAVINHPRKFQSEMNDEHAFLLIWDSGASVSITNDKTDPNKVRDVPDDYQVQGLAKGAQVESQGVVEWYIKDVNGRLRCIELLALYIPAAGCRLLSTTSLLQRYQGESIKLESQGLKPSGVRNDPDRGPIKVKIEAESNLPKSICYHRQGVNRSVRAFVATVTTVDERNINLSAPQKVWSQSHIRFGHAPFRVVQFVLRTGVLSNDESSRRLHTTVCKLTTPPLCAACLYGKQKTRHSPGQKTVKIQDKEGALKKDNLFPGQQVSADHFICSTKGRLYTSKGKTKEEAMLSGGCIFVDHASGYIDVSMQTHLNTHQTLKAKTEYEQQCQNQGVIIQQYHTDNGTAFTSKKYTEHLQAFQQVTSFAGVGAHHHNGVAERSIQTIMSMARTMMLHAATHWPEVVDPTLWPMAVDHAVFIYNRLPKIETGISPIDLFTKTRWEQRRFHDLHVWGAPAYVLNKTIQDGKKLPRWKPRSQRCMFVGFSQQHALTAPLVLNLDTGTISPQYHVVFDDWFATVAATNKSSHSPHATVDQIFANMDNILHSPGYDDPSADDNSPNDTPEATASELTKNKIFEAMEKATPPVPLEYDTPAVPPTSTTAGPPLPHPVSTPRPASTPPSVPSSPADAPPRMSTNPLPTTLAPPHKIPPISLEDDWTMPTEQRESTPTQAPPAPKSQPPELKQQREQTNQREPSNQREHASPAPRRSGQNRRSPNRLVESMDPTHKSYLAHVDTLDNLPFQATIGLFKATIVDPDTLSYDQASKDADLLHWRKAAKQEIDELTEKETWIEAPQSAAKTKILPGTWVFKRKRHADGTIKKHKGRYCVRGDLQEQAPDAYSPVVNWAIIRICMIYALSQQWVMVCIDFSNAFVQAKLKEPIWIHIPPGFKSTSSEPTCLRLLKSLYGLTIAPRLWYEKLIEALLEDGFKKSNYDECFFMKPDMLLFIWVDDCGIVAPTMTLVDAFIERLKTKGFELSKDSDFADYLGINFKRNKDEIVMTQPGLIKRILQTTKMEDCNGNWTPAA